MLEPCNSVFNYFLQEFSLIQFRIYPCTFDRKCWILVSIILFINEVANRITLVGNFRFFFSFDIFNFSFFFSFFFDQHRSILTDRMKSEETSSRTSISFLRRTFPARSAPFLSFDTIMRVRNGREETGRKCHMCCARERVFLLAFPSRGTASAWNERRPLSRAALARLAAVQFAIGDFIRAPCQSSAWTGLSHRGCWRRPRTASSIDIQFCDAVCIVYIEENLDCK